MQKIAQATARVLCAAGVDFGVLGKDGEGQRPRGPAFRRGNALPEPEGAEHRGHPGRRGETDRDFRPPRLQCALKDYKGCRPSAHQRSDRGGGAERAAEVQAPLDGRRRPMSSTTPATSAATTALRGAARGPRRIPGLRRAEMDRNCRDRSFCCGGGGLMLFYEPEEEQRMGVVRVKMAQAAGADVIVTACPSAWSTSRTPSRWRARGPTGGRRPERVIDRHIQR
jgi:hypothetical protein